MVSAIDFSHSPTYSNNFLLSFTSITNCFSLHSPGPRWKERIERRMENVVEKPIYYHLHFSRLGLTGRSM